MRASLACWGVLIAFACGDGDGDAARAPSEADSGGAGSGGSSAGGSGGSGGASVDAGSTGASEDDPCSAEALRTPSTATTYYVAIDEPGADNETCDGLAPSDEGDGHCPFRDLDSDRTRSLLDGAAGVRVELRAGRYVVRGWDGLRVHGLGSSEGEAVVLSAYPGEQPVLDVPAPDGEGCTEMTAPDDPRCVRQVVRVSGTHTVVQGLTIQNGLGYHVEVTGGEHHLLRCNTLGETVAFAMRSDCLKLDGGARDVEVRHNDFSRFRSQAIDMTQVFDVLIEGNDFHDPIDADAGATGAKYGATDVTIRGNRVHDMGSNTAMHVFSLGGTGTEHPDDHTAFRIRVEGNQVWNIAGILAQLVSCEDCALEDNDLWDAGAGILLSSAATGTPECTLGAAGCGPSSGTRIAGNRMRDLNGGGDAAQANVFVAVEAGEDGGLQAEGNVYCAPAAGDARFVLGGEPLDFDAWSAALGAEQGSSALPASDTRCAF